MGDDLEYIPEEEDENEDLQKFIKTSTLTNAEKKRGLKNGKYIFDKTDNDKTPDFDAEEAKKHPYVKPSIIVPKSFRIKTNRKKYKLHHVAFPGTWQMDLMFGKVNTFLIAIEVNTRYVVVQRTNTHVRITKQIYLSNGKGQKKIETKSEYAIAKAFNYLLKEREGGVWRPSTLISDSEPAFKTPGINRYIYKKYGIKHKIVYLVKTDDGTKSSNHTSLALIDRVIRTCKDYVRDFIGADRNILTIENVNKFVNYYNNEKPHSTLCKIFKRKDVTPKMVHDDMNMEMEVMRYFMMKNKEIKATTIGLEIPDGTLVKMYNPKDKFGKRTRITKSYAYRVLNHVNNIYNVQNVDIPEEILKAPRIWLEEL